MRGPDLFCGVVPSHMFMSMTRVLKLDGTGCDVLLKVSGVPATAALLLINVGMCHLISSCATLGLYLG
jgi:hypothetical protein